MSSRFFIRDEPLSADIDGAGAQCQRSNNRELIGKLVEL